MAAQDQKAEMKLVARAQKNLRSFEILYERYFDKVYKYFHFRLRDEAQSQDLTSETFEKALSKLYTFQDQGYHFSAWLFSIARNVLIDFFRKNEGRITTSLDDLLPGEQPFHEIDTGIIDNEQAIEKVKNIIKTLPQTQQDIWALKLGSDIPHKQIADILGMTENNVNVSIFRSIQVIKTKFIR